MNERQIIKAQQGSSTRDYLKERKYMYPSSTYVAPNKSLTVKEAADNRSASEYRQYVEKQKLIEDALKLKRKGQSPLSNTINDMGTNMLSMVTGFRGATNEELEQGRGSWSDRSKLIAGSATQGMVNELTGGAMGWVGKRLAAMEAKKLASTLTNKAKGMLPSIKSDETHISNVFKGAKVKEPTANSINQDEYIKWSVTPRGTPAQVSAVEKGNQWNNNWFQDPEIQTRIAKNNYELLMEGRSPINPAYPVRSQIPNNGALKYLEGQGMGPSKANGVYVGERDIPYVHLTDDLAQMESTSVHEGGHQFTKGNDGLSSNTQRELLRPFGGPYGISQSKKLLTAEERQYADYLTDPTEIRERIGQLRHHYKLKPSHEVTPNMVDAMMKDAQSGNSPVGPSFFNLMRDRRLLGETFKKVFTPAAPLTAVGIKALQTEKANP